MKKNAFLIFSLFLFFSFASANETQTIDVWVKNNSGCPLKLVGSTNLSVLTERERFFPDGGITIPPYGNQIITGLEIRGSPKKIFLSGLFLWNSPNEAISGGSFPLKKDNRGWWEVSFPETPDCSPPQKILFFGAEGTTVAPLMRV